MNNFWTALPKPFFILAPMEAVTDTVFRHVVKKAATPDVYFTEFTNATGWLHAGDKATGVRLVKTDDEHPLVTQLWGTDPEAMEKLAKHCADQGFDGIDINMGCPDSSAIKSGGGAAMIKTPELAAEMIAAAKKSGLPVSVKTRLGYASVTEYRDWVTFLLQQDIVALTMHLRTKKEMSKVDAHWEIMTDIRQLRDEIAPSTLLIGNGDVRDRAHGLELIGQTDIDGIMIGRGIFHDPWAFEVDQREHTLEESIALLRFQLDLFESTWAQQRVTVGGAAPNAHAGSASKHLGADQPAGPAGPAFDTLKRFFKIYVRNFPEAGHVRDELMRSKSIAETRAVLDAHF